MTEEDSVFEDSAGASSSTLTEDKDHDISRTLEAMLYADLSPTVTKKVVFANRAASSDHIFTSDYPSSKSHYDRLKPQRDWSSADVLDQPRSILASRTGNRSAQPVSKATQLWRELVLHLHQEIVAKEKYPLVTFRYYDDCFFGSELIDCMVPFLRQHCHQQTISRSHTLAVCHRLLLSGVMINVQVPSNTLFQELSLYRFPNRPSWTETESQSEDSCISVENKTISSRLKCVSNMVKGWKKLVQWTRPEHSPTRTEAPKQSSRKIPIPQKVSLEGSNNWKPIVKWEPINFGSEVQHKNNISRVRMHSSPQVQSKSPVLDHSRQFLSRSSSCSSLTSFKPTDKHKDVDTTDWKIYGYV